VRIVLISPQGPLYRYRGGIFSRFLRYAPLTLTTLASLVPPELGASIEIRDEGIEEIDLDLNADVVGMTVITGTAPRAYELADHFRSRGLKVVLGGPHVTLEPEEASAHCDAIVIGYAEETWPKLLEDYSRGEMKPRYDQGEGLSLAGRAFARRDLLRRFSYATRNTFEATRGCVHQCDFCVVPTAWGQPLHRPVDEVMADIRQNGSRRILFLDLNLISDASYAREMFTALIPLRVKWAGLTTTAIARDDELLDLAARSGCWGLLLGFESLSKDSLAETRKSFAMREDYHHVVQQLHRRRIAIMACFAFGFDHDTSDSFAETVDFVQHANIDLPRYAILTPFPATPLFRRLEQEGRILTKDWNLYDGQHVVFRPLQMSAEELRQGTEQAWKSTYRFSSIAKRLHGARIQLPISIAANLGYRYYASHLHRTHRDGSGA